MRDNDDSEFDSPDAAVQGAARSAAEIGQSRLAKGDTSYIGIEVRNEHNQRVFTITASMNKYGNAKTADNPKDAGALSSSVMKESKVMEARFNAARAQLAGHASVEPTRIGAVSYCFGGAVVLNMACAGATLAAVASFHASLGLNTPAPALGTVTAKILVLNGADDPFVKREQYEALRKNFDAAKAEYRVVQYPGAVHAFTNPEATELGQKFNLPLRYDAQVDREAKAVALKFASSSSMGMPARARPFRPLKPMARTTSS